jgi:hypothetical protein
MAKQTAKDPFASIATPMANTAQSRESEDPFASIATPFKKKVDTALSGKTSSTAGKSELAEDNSAWYDWDNIKKAGTNLVNFGKGLGQEIPSEVTRMMGDMISSFGLTVDLGARYSSAGINYLMGDKKQAQKDIDSDPTFLTKYLIDAGNYLSENADKTKDDTLKNWGVSDKNRNPQRSFYDAFSDGDLGDGSAMLFRDVLATVPQVVAATLTGGGSLEAQALRTSGGLLKQTALSEIGAIASSELPAILSTGLKSQTGAQFKFGLGLGTSSSLAGEYKKDNHVTATDFLESIARGVVEGASESLFDTDILAAKKLASRFVNVSDNPAIRGIMASIADEGEDAAREKIVRTTTDILGKAFAGGRNEGLEEVASSFGNMLIDVTKQGGFTMDSLDKFKKEAVESFIVGSLSGGLISGGAARMSRVKLTDVQQKTIDRYNEVVNDESLSDDARNIAKSRIKDILDYNASLSKENYGLIAALPKEKRTEALEYLSKMNQLEDDIKSAKDLAPDIEAQIKSYEDKVNNLIDEEYKAQREERRRKTMSQSEIDTEDIVNMFQTIQPEGISIEDMDSAINEVRNKVNGKEEVDQEDINSANDMLYEILDKIEKSELTSEQKKVASEPFFNQIEQLQSYDKIIKTTEVITPIQEVTRTTRETGRVERPKTTVMTDRFNLEPVEVTDSEGAKSNYVARVDENGGISLVPKVKFSRTAKEQKRKTIELDSNLLQFQESIKDENDRVIGAKLLDRKTGNIIEISNPELAIDLATRAKQETLGNVSEGLMQQETTVKPIGEMTSIVKEFVNKRTTAQAPIQEVALEETEEQPSLTTEMPSSPVGLPSRKAYVVAADIINKMGNRILNKVSPENKARISNYVKAAKSLMPDLNVVLYDNKADMIQGLVNQGNSLEDATKAVNESKGLFSQMGNTIHIDVTRMDKETLAHEIFHPLVSRLADENPAEFTEMRNRISKVLSGSDLAALDRFAKMYAEDGVDVSAEEFLAQLAALVTTNKVKFKRGEVQKIAMAIKEFIKKIAKKINSKQLSDFADSFFNENTKTEELIKFFEGYGRSLRQGAEINVEALNLPAEGFIAPEGNLRQQKITSVKNIDVKEVRTLSRAGNRVSKGLSVSTKDGKKVVQEAEDLSLEYVKANAPELFIANANIIANYPLVSGILNKGNIASIEDAQEVYDVFSREIANNLEYLMDNFNQNYKDVSTLWYDGANILAQDLSKKYGVTTEQVAGIIASLSPQKDWYQNVRLAEMVLMAHEANPVMSKEMVDKQRLIAQEGLKPSLKALNQAKKSYKDSKTKANKEKLDAAKEKYDSNVSNSNKLIDAISELVGKNMNDVPNEMKGYYIRLWNEVNTTKDYNILSPDGQVMGLAAKNNGEKAKVAWGSYTEINKANAIYLDGSQENITRSLGEMHKIRNFYNNIIDPMSKDQDVTMDTHAIAAALLMPLSGNSTQVGQNFGTGTKNSSPLGIKGLYYAYAEGYKLAAKETDLLPRQVQSITWEAIRGLFTATFKNSKQNVAKIESIWDNYANNKISIDETRKQIDEFSGGIKDPTWARPIQEGVAENIEEGAVGRGVDGARQGDVGESARDRLRQQKENLAPNGKPSNLTEGQYNQVRTPEFKAWFGDWENDPENASKVVDENGEPMVMYHGTSKDKDFDSFKISDRGAWFSSSPAEASSYASSNDSQKMKYDDKSRKYITTNTSSRVIPVFLNIRNLAKQEDISKNILEEYRKTGYKSYRNAQKYLFNQVRYKDRTVEGFAFDRKEAGAAYNFAQVIVLFDGTTIEDGDAYRFISNQPNVKSAIGNSGKFSPTKPSILQQKSYPDALAESRKEYADKNKNSFKEVSRYIRKLIFERNINIKKAMQDAELEFSLYTMYNKAGASMFGNLKFTETFNEIYGDLSQEEIKLLDNFVFLRRVVAIDSNFDNRKEDRPKHTAHNNIDGINTVTTKESALSTLEDYKDLLGDELYDKVYSASDKYFNAFSNILKYKYENGLISKDTYELYKDYNYSPRKFLKFVFGNSIGEEALSPNNFYQRGLSLSANEIKNIKDGADTGILVDSVKLLHAAMIATEVRVASNLALKTLYQEAIPQNLDFVKEVEYETDANGTIKVNEDGSLKYKTKADDGFRIVTFKDNGIVSAFQLREDLAKEYFDEELFDKNSKAYKAAQLATGANILRNMATGMNLAFPITNIPVDVISQVQLNNIYDGAGVGVAGQYTKALAGTISNSLKLIPLEFGKSNQEIEDLIYEYGKAGGLMMSMSQEYAAKDKFFGAMAQYLGAFGNASEMASKLTAYKTVKEAEIAKFKSANNGAMPIGSDMTKIQTKAAYIARAAMDYHRGGLLTKWIDGFVPYLNVFSQGSKITIDYIRNNPKAFTDKIVQTGLFVAALTIYNMAVAGSDYDNDDNEQDLATKIVVFLPFKNADGTRGKIEIGAPAPVKGFLNIFQNMGEGIYHQIIAQDEQRYDAWKAKVNAKFVNMFSTNLATNIPPALKALIEYSYNLDLWRGGKVYEKMGEVLPQDEGRYDKNVAEFYKVLGSATGKSPKRMQKAAENFITQSNPLVGVGYSLMDKMINQYQSLPESQRSKFDTGKISDIPVSLFDKISGRIYSVTDPKVIFKKNSDVIDKINQEAGSKKMEVKAEMKLLIEKKASTEEMNAYLIKQDPIYRRAARDYAILLKKESLLKYPTNKDEYFDIMLGANAEAKAQIIYAYFPHLLMEGNQDLRHDLSMLNLFGEDTKRIFNGYHKNKGIPK